MVAKYENFGIKFSYPENWKLQEDQRASWPHSVSVYSPNDAFWNVLVHEPGTNMESAAEAVKEAIEEEYEGVEVEPVEEKIEHLESKGYDLFFYCLDMLVQTRVRAIEAGDLRLLIICQGEDREFDKLNQVFSAISIDLVRD
ncbi:MAG: hypothetical protein ACKVH8_06860 [Pirellulales bacterium]|jgi:hypothetical protein